MGGPRKKNYVSDKNTLHRYLIRFKKNLPRLQNAPVIFLIPIFMKPSRICRTKCRISGISLPHPITCLIIMPSSGSTVAYHSCGTIRCSSEAMPGANRAVIYYSLACSCRQRGINFFEYISDIMNRAAILPPTVSVESYRELLPDKWHKS